MTAQEFTGANVQTVVLPVVTTLRLGHRFIIVNNSTGTVTVNSSGGNAVASVTAGVSATLYCILITGTTAASWHVVYNLSSADNTEAVAFLNGGAISHTRHDAEISGTIELSGAGTTTLTVDSTSLQMFQGASTRTYVLPAATTLQLGHKFTFINNGNYTITINANGGGLVTSIPSTQSATIYCTFIGTSAGIWQVFPGGEQFRNTLTMINGSGATANVGDIGYRDTGGYYVTTTTANLAASLYVVITGGVYGDPINVARTGYVTVNYTGTAPSAGQWLTTSTSAGLAQRSTTKTFACFAVVIGDLGGGQCSAQLLVEESDANLQTYDITTNDASTTKHGFLKKLSNVSTEFMNGQGAWATPAGGSSVINNYLTGLTLTNGTDATNDINIAAGYCADSGNAVMMTGAALTKQLDATWAVGTNAGMRASGAAIANAVYHIFLIRRTDTGVVDVAADTSETGANITANTAATYTQFRRIGSIIRLSGAIKTFIQDGNQFMWSTPVLDVNSTNPGTNAVTRTLTVPTGIRVKALMSAIGYGTSNAAYTNNVYISDLSVADTAASATAGAWSFTAYWTPAGEFAIGSPVSAMTNTSAQVRSRIQYSAAGTTLFILTNGWEDSRGRDG
jgi:hypothetical protein